MYRATYTTGSSCFLPNAQDHDIIHIYDTKEECRNALIHLKQEEGVCVHFETYPPRVFLGCYIYHFMEHLEGEELPLKDFSIFEHKEEYIALLKHHTTYLRKTSKLWYHILTACYMFKNGSYELTDSQLQAIQRTHDKGITDAKYKFCLDTLEEYGKK